MWDGRACSGGGPLNQVACGLAAAAARGLGGGSNRRSRAMSRKPSYPKDAAVGEAAADASEKGGEGSKRTKHLVAGAAIGIGSAALVAALLYANRNRKNDD